MNNAAGSPRIETAPTALLPEEQAWLGLPSVLTAPMQRQLERMFRDPHTLGREERAELIGQLREAIALAQAPELRVLLGMVLCVDSKARRAREELRSAARMAPYNFSARLQLGEMLRRLRLCDQAAEQTRVAEGLATTALQLEMARRQAASIRAMERERVSRRGHAAVVTLWSRARQVFIRE